MVTSLLLLPFTASAQLDIQDGYAIQGKIFAVKTAKNTHQSKVVQRLLFLKIR